MRAHSLVLLFATLLSTSLVTAQSPLRVQTAERINGTGVLVANVTDKFTGEPLSQVRVLYVGLDANESGSYVDSSSQVEMRIPADLDFAVVVAAKGYKGWIYIDPANADPTLRLHCDERKTLDVQLEPDDRDARR